MTPAPHHRRSRARGFTLIEVMVALALMLGVATALFQTMQLTFGTKTRISKLNDRYHEGRAVMSRIARELRMAFLIAEVPEDMREEDPAMVTHFKGEDDEIYFATTAHLRLHAGSRESDQAEVAYFLKSGDSDDFKRGKTLYRRESKRLDSRPDRGGMVWPVLHGVKEFKIEYWDDAKEIGDDAWESSWDSEDNELLPSRVRVTLELEPGEDVGRKPIRFVTQAAPRIRRPIAVLDAHRRAAGVAGQIRGNEDLREQIRDRLNQQQQGRNNSGVVDDTGGSK